MATIEVRGLSKRFGALQAVDGISFTVRCGEVVGFLGPNGAGKSTTMKMISGFLPPTAGTAVVAGFDILTQPLEAKRRLGYLPEGAPAYGDMTVGAFLDYVGALRGLDAPTRRRRIGELSERVQLAEVFDRRIETLSKGFKRRVGIAQALLHDPEALILDEPTDGLDPNQKHEVRELIRAMAPDKAIIVSTHILEEVEAVCARAVIIARGRIVADDTPEGLLARAGKPKAISLTVRGLDHDRAVSALSRLPGIEKVEVAGKVNGVANLRVLAGQELPPLAEVGSALSREGLPLDDIRIERPRLEDVFRQITLH